MTTTKWFLDLYVNTTYKCRAKQATDANIINNIIFYNEVKYGKADL